MIEFPRRLIRKPDASVRDAPVIRVESEQELRLIRSMDRNPIAKEECGGAQRSRDSGAVLGAHWDRQVPLYIVPVRGDPDRVLFLPQDVEHSDWGREGPFLALPLELESVPCPRRSGPNHFSTVQDKDSVLCEMNDNVRAIVLDERTIKGKVSIKRGRRENHTLDLAEETGDLPIPAEWRNVLGMTFGWHKK
jgi:hypothetical protein